MITLSLSKLKNMKKYVAFILVMTILVSCKDTVKIEPVIEKATSEDHSKISASQFEKIKSLEGEWYLVNEEAMLKYGPLDRPFITYDITSAGNAVIEKLFFEGEKEMTTVYHRDLDDLVMTHYCTLGNQPFFIANPSPSDSLISFDFVKLGNMNDANEAHIHRHELEFISENEMIAHWGTWKDQAPFGKDRAFHVIKK